MGTFSLIPFVSHLDCVQEPQKLHSTTFRLCARATETTQHYI